MLRLRRSTEVMLRNPLCQSAISGLFLRSKRKNLPKDMFYRFLSPMFMCDTKHAETLHVFGPEFRFVAVRARRLESFNFF